MRDTSSFFARPLAAALASLVFGVLASSSAEAQAPTVAPLIEQVHVQAGLSFVQVSNPSATDAAPLADLYLATTPTYPRIVDGETSGLGASDFVLRFPAGASIPASGSVVVQVGAGTPAAFEAAFGVRPDFVVQDPGAAEPARMASVEGVALPTAELERTAGLLVLFYWDGQSDRVQDCDIVFWGDGARVDKSAQQVDGPDADMVASVYADDTPAAEQLAAPVPAEGQALHRLGDEVGEATGGNGLTGHDETSEDLATAFGAGPVTLGPVAPPEHVTLTGRVVAGPRVLSVADLTVEILGDGTDLSTTTDTTGGFAFVLPVNASLSATVSGPSIQPFQTTVTTVESDLNDVEWEVEGLWHLGGLVVSGTGEPVVAGLVVTVLERGQSLTLDESGEFLFVLDSPGVVTLQVDGAGIAPIVREVELAEDNVLGLDLTVDAAFDLRGRALANPSGDGIEGAAVTLVELGETQLTDADGTFAFMDLSRGLWTLHVEAEGFEPTEVEVDLVSDQDVEVRLASEAVHRLEVRVVTNDAETASGATVTLVGLSGGERVTGTADASGVVTFVALRSDNYLLSVAHGGYAPLTLRAIPVVADASVTVMLVSVNRTPHVVEESCAVASAPSRGAWPSVGWGVGLVLLGLIVARRRRG